MQHSGSDEGNTLNKVFSSTYPQKIKQLSHAWRKMTVDGWDKTIASDFLAKLQQFINLTEAADQQDFKNALLLIEQNVKRLATADAPPSEEQLTIVLLQIDKLLNFANKPQSTHHLSTEKSDGHCHIFVATDKNKIAQEISEQFNYFGFVCTHFSSMEKIIEAVNNEEMAQELTAIIIDTSLDFDAVELYVHIPVNVPLLFISEKEDIETRLLAVRSGGKAFFQTPIDYSALIEKVDELVNPFMTSSPIRVLMVEDSPTQGSIIQQHLTEANMLVDLVTDPFKLNDKLRDFSPDLILMDLYMPECTGIELAAVVRQQEMFVSIPIVFLSAEKNISKQLNAMSLGGDDFLTKPIEKDHLIASIRTRVQRSRILRAEMIQDSLTGLLNHTRILEQLQLEVARAKRDNQPLCFAMIDIDYFKSVNDTYGHQVGDRVIKSLARLFKQRFRKSDSIGRYGGEEFAAILPQASLKDIHELIEEIRVGFSQLVHKSQDAKTEFHVTISAGVSELGEEYPSADSIVQAADRALYDAKNQGRNKVVIAKGLSK